MKAMRWALVLLLLILPMIAALAVRSMVSGGARAADPVPQREGAPRAPETQLHVQINYFLELHNELLLASTPNGTTLLDTAAYRSEIESYKQARGMVKEFKVWQIVNDACVEAPDIAAIRGMGESLSADLSAQDREAVKRMLDIGESLSADLSAQDREAVKRMLDALGTAYSRWAGKEMLLRKRGFNVFVLNLLDRKFDPAAKQAIMSEVDGKMGFLPLDAPLGIYIVVDAAEVGAWGKTRAGYYIVIPVQNREVSGVIEAIVHEATHLLDARQPAGSSSLLNRLRAKLSGADTVALDTLLHGLVAFNAGQMVKRHVKSDYTPIVEVSPTWREQLAPYLPALQGAWNEYLDGKIGADKAVGELAATLKRPAPTK